MKCLTTLNFTDKMRPRFLSIVSIVHSANFIFENQRKSKQ